MINLFEKTYIKVLFLIIILILFISYFSINQSVSYIPTRIIVRNHSNPQVRIYCLILTSPQFFDTRARAVYETWAPRCDKFHFISESSNNTKGLPIAPIANLIPGRDHLTQKSVLAFHYAYENFFNTTDWFVKADDDTYLFVDNLKTFLKTQNTSLPITFGYNFKIIVANGYHSGGGGYVLSKEAIKRFYEEHHKPNTNCAKDGGSEDVEIANCLRKTGVYPGISLDEHNRERFHALSFSTHVIGPIPDWLSAYAANKPVTGINCCSTSTISFHYITPENQYMIDKMYYRFQNRT